MEQMAPGEIWVYNSGHVWIFVVRGDLDAHLSTDLHARLEGALIHCPDALLIDLEEATFMDASAVGILVSVSQRAQANGTVLRLVAPSAPAKRLLHLTRTEDVFLIEGDLVTAYARVTGRVAGPKKASGVDDAA